MQCWRQEIKHPLHPALAPPSPSETHGREIGDEYPDTSAGPIRCLLNVGGKASRRLHSRHQQERGSKRHQVNVGNIRHGADATSCISGNSVASRTHLQLTTLANDTDRPQRCRIALRLAFSFHHRSQQYLVGLQYQHLKGRRCSRLCLQYSASAFPSSICLLAEQLDSRSGLRDWQINVHRYRHV